jgi:hypothetical protein
MDATNRYDVESMLANYQRSFQVERWLHPERFPDELPSSLYRLLRSVKRTKEAIELWLWEHLGLKNDEIPVSLESRWNLAFIGGESIRSLQLYLGAYCESGAISRVILGPEVAVLKQNIGEVIYHFVLHRAPVLMKISVPEFPKTIQDNSILQDRIQQKGKWIVEALLAGAPSALLGRFVLQFPRGVTWDFSHGASQDDLTIYERMTDIILNKAMSIKDVETRG